ncbi:MAG: hypothetical protein ACM36C_11495, partial [Acidobacteriota bacterium]
MGMRRGVFGAIAILACVSSSMASAEPFAAGNVLRVSFDLSGIYGGPIVEAPGGQLYTFPQDADTFLVSVLVNSGTGVNTFNVRLFDGDRLLGTAAAPAAPVINSPYPAFANSYFQSPTS